MCILGAFPDLLPIRLVWLGALTSITGGGIMVGLALLYTMLADTNVQAERYFFPSFLLPSA